jgi:hypothetical protein
VTKAEISRQVGDSAKLSAAASVAGKVRVKKTVKAAPKVVSKEAASLKVKGSTSKKASTPAKKAVKKVTRKLTQAELEAKAKLSYDRVVKLRADRLKLGLKRHDVYVHDDDWAEVKGLVAEKHQLREAMAEKRAKRPIEASR